MSVLLSDETQKLVKIIGSNVTKNDIDCYERVQKINDSSHRLRTIIDSWEKQQSEERSLRRKYAALFLIGLFVEALIANVAFFLIGLGIINVSDWVANCFIVGVFGQIATITLVISRYLFPKTGNEVLDIIRKL